jgi:DNA-binding ferritin-like protein
MPKRKTELETVVEHEETEYTQVQHLTGLGNELKSIRSQSREQKDSMKESTARTIANLEHWIAEIEATITFLKSMRK